MRASTFQASDRRSKHSCSNAGALCKFLVIDAQNVLDQITSDRRNKRADWFLYILFIPSGSPNECCL